MAIAMTASNRFIFRSSRAKLDRGSWVIPIRGFSPIATAICEADGHFLP
jgi:hypothetical protein